MKSHKKSLKNKKAAGEHPTPLTADQETAFEELTHIPDRDQVFEVDHKSFPPDTEMLYDDSWTGDTNQHLNDDRSTGKDFVNALRDLDAGSRKVGPFPKANETPTVVNRADDKADAEDFDVMPDKRLKSLADAMAIPERAKMTRHEMIEAVRSLGASH